MGALEEFGTMSPVITPHRVPHVLRPLVAGIVGFDETAADGRARVQPAGSLLVLEISFTTPLNIGLGDGHDTDQAHHAFLAGFMPRPVRTEFVGRHASVQVYLTPSGASTIFGLPGRHIAGHVTPLTDLVPHMGANLPDKLADASSWAQRFKIVDEALLDLWAAAAPPDPLVDWMWATLNTSGGQTRISDLSRRSGWSTRHLTARFTDVVGIPPKRAAGVIRFERVHREQNFVPLAELAARHGYSDQSHLTREVRRYSGESPVQLAREERPTAFTAIGRP